MRTTPTMVFLCVFLSCGFFFAQAHHQTEAKQQLRQQSARPYVSFSGADSSRTKPGYLMATNQTEWVKIWRDHKGLPVTSLYDHYYNKIGLPVVDFDQCVVLAVFVGKSMQTAGVTLDAIDEGDKEIRIRYVNRVYSTATIDTSKPQNPRPIDKAYGLFVLPKFSKPIVLEQGVYRSKRQPPDWVERHRFARIDPTQSK